MLIPINDKVAPTEINRYCSRKKSVEYSPMGHWRWSSVGQTTSANILWYIMRIIAWGQRNTSPMNMFLKFNEL